MSRPRVLVIGVGSIGERHLRCFGQTGRTELTFCETNESLRNEIKDRYQVDRAFADFDQALVHPPDAAVICTPAHLHIPIAVQLAERGVHLLIEKPLSISLDGVKNLFDVVAQQNLTAAVAYTSRMNSLLADMRREILSGRFGRAVQLTSVGGQQFPFYRPAYREIYYKDRGTGGGAIQDALTHQVNSAEWLVGPMTKVSADAAHQVLEGVEVEDTVHVIARHGELQASYSLNQHQAPNESTITVVCEHGTARIEMHKHRWRWKTEPDEPWHDKTQGPVERDSMFVSQANMFLDAIEEDAPVACSLEEGLQTLRANLAILRAADTHTWQDV